MLIQNINPNKLHDELVTNGIHPLNVSHDKITGEFIAQNTWITFEEATNMEQVQQILNAHDPTPIPKPLTEIEKIRLEQAQSTAELFEMMLVLTGGGV